jgi:hypothetical protein
MLILSLINFYYMTNEDRVRKMERECENEEVLLMEAPLFPSLEMIVMMLLNW